MEKWYLVIFALLSFTLASTKGSSQRTLDAYESGHVVCYNRLHMPYTAVVDTHLHFRPFGVTEAPSFEQVVQYLRDAGVLFANIYGIGQVLPFTSECTDISKNGCSRVPVRPSFRNDILNTEGLIKWRDSRYIIGYRDIHFIPSMTFPDLSDPDSVVRGIHFLDSQYSPELFRWMGEVNLVKQFFFNRGMRVVPKSKIPDWELFMTILRERHMPLAIHSDLGNDSNPTEYISWMEEVLRLYPDNKIVWVHAGISLELTTMDVDQHIEVLSSFLDRYPHLMLDFSWSILNKNYFSSNEDNRNKYVDFINQYSTRILPGTDFVATNNKDFSSYLKALERTSFIYQYVSDEAFRNIALGENYFRLLSLEFQAPPICQY